MNTLGMANHTRTRLYAGVSFNTCCCFEFVMSLLCGSLKVTTRSFSPPAGPPPNRRGRGGGNRGRGRFNVRRDGPVKFEEDFDFETANAQFNKDEIDKELQSKLKLKGMIILNSAWSSFQKPGPSLTLYLAFLGYGGR